MSFYVLDVSFLPKMKEPKYSINVRFLAIKPVNNIDHVLIPVQVLRRTIIISISNCTPNVHEITQTFKQPINKISKVHNKSVSFK